MTEQDPERLADELEREARELEQRSEGLQQDVDETRADWQRKRADQAVPGAMPEEKEHSSDKEEEAGSSPEHEDS